MAFHDRIAALQSYRILDTPPEPLFDELTAAAADIFGAPSAALCLIDKDRQWLKSACNCEWREVAVSESLCVNLIDDPKPVVIENAKHDWRCAGKPFVDVAGGIGFYAGAPLVTSEGFCIGMLSVFDRVPRQPRPREVDALRRLADVAMGLIEAHKSKALFANERDHLLKMADTSPGGLFEFAMNAAGDQWLNYVSAGIRDTIGISPEEALTDIQNVFRHIVADDIQEFLDSIDVAYRQRSSWQFCFRVNHPVRGVIHVRGASEPVSKTSDVVRWHGCLLDVTDRVIEEQRREAMQADLEARYRQVTQYQTQLRQVGRLAKIGACVADLKTSAAQWSPGVYEILELDRSFVPRFGDLVEFAAPRWKERVRSRANEAVRSGGMQLEYPVTTTKGKSKWLRMVAQTEYDPEGAPARIIASLQDVTRQRELLERLRYNATHDCLTGLTNRPAFFRQLLRQVSSSRSGDSHALLLLDLDHLKDVNDAFGYSSGDRVIKNLSERLAGCDDLFGASVDVARFGSDEFAVLVKDMDDPLDLPEKVQALLDRLSTETPIGEASIQVSASIGFSIYPSDATDAVTMARQADLALRSAKKAGKCRFAHYTAAMDAEASAIQVLRTDIMRGVKAKEFELYYQPVIDLRDGSLNGFESLLRWHHPDRGLQSAGAFARLLDEPTIGRHISELVLDQASRTAMEWAGRGLEFGQIAVNITSSQLRNPLFEDRLGELIRTGLSPATIKLEITEGVLLGRAADRVAVSLRSLQALGFTIALDDFGTGYASLIHLGEFPVDQIKIDMSFVGKIAASKKDRMIVETMCALANGLGLTTVAEGIEDRKIAEMLRGMGCQYGQGYHYAKALTRQDAEVFIAESHGRQKAKRSHESRMRAVSAL